MSKYKLLQLPAGGKPVKIIGGKVKTPDEVIIPFIEGDGTGPDIWAASVRVFDAAVKKAFKGKKKVHWFEILAGQKAYDKTGEWLPAETIKAIKEYVVAIKGPLTTPVGGGIRSLNVALRQILDLYACVRPVRYFKGVVSPMTSPEKVNLVIFRENTEDVYSGVEWKAGSREAREVVDLLNKKYKKGIRPGSAIGVKPVSAFCSKRLVRRAIQFALDHGRSSVTLVHKGNIMKFTEGAFKDWGYELAKAEFKTKVVSEDELWKRFNGKVPKGKIVIKDRIADNMFQQLLLRPSEYDVLATLNLNGDYLSDAAAAQVGGLGLAPGSNIGDKAAVFEATHGTAPNIAGTGKANPGSLILSGVMMLEYLGWDEAAEHVYDAMEHVFAKRKVTSDLHSQMEGATLLTTSEFADEIIKNMH